MFTIITPVDLGRRPQQLLDRLNRLIAAAQHASFQLVIGHADRGTRHDLKLKESVAACGNERVVLVSEVAKSAVSNQARLRNIAVQRAEREVLLLLDVDIFPDIQLFQTMAEAVAAKGAGLAMAPCVYLTERSEKLLLNSGNGEKILKSFHAFSPDFVLHWAFPSSVMTLRIDDYWRVGGFHEGYQGHGYEDLEFMIRIALCHDLIQPTASLKVDRSYRAPLLAEGFRGHLGRLCIPNLLDGNIAFHLHHGKDGKESYYLGRQRNSEIFKERISDLLESYPAIESEPSRVSPMIISFFDECAKRGVDPSYYFALFDPRPRHLIRTRPLLPRLWQAASSVFS
jgi:predicted glycosyltransferase involved in capsule biosynthesis